MPRPKKKMDEPKEPEEMKPEEPAEAPALEPEEAPKESEEPKEPEPTSAEEPAPEMAPDLAKSWAVHDKRGAFVRTYSVEVHGENADKLAEQFASKIGGSVKA